MALGMMSELHDVGFQANSITCNAALSACEKGNQWQRALVLFQMLKTSGQGTFVTHCAALGACAEGIQWLLALQVLGNMREVQMHSLVASCMAAHACEFNFQTSKFRMVLAILETDLLELLNENII